MLAYVEIPLSQGQTALVSVCDLPKVFGHGWFAYRIAGSGQTGSVYLYGFKAGYKAKGRNVWMHNVIMDPPEGYEVDHINHDPLDNRRENLRVVSHAENCRNRGKRRAGGSSQWLGVSWNKEKGRWRASVTKGGRRKLVGSFENEVDAAQAYNLAVCTDPLAAQNVAPQPWLTEFLAS